MVSKSVMCVYVAGGMGGGVLYKFVYNCLPASLTTVRLFWFLVGGCCFCCFLLNK